MTSPTEFTAVFESTTGIGGYTLSDDQHKVFAYDGSSSGKLDHLVLYRPGTGQISVLRNSSGTFTPIYQAASGGIGGFDLSFQYDTALAFDFKKKIAG